MEETNITSPVQIENPTKIKSIKAYQLKKWIFRRVKAYLIGRILDTDKDNGLSDVYQENGIEIDYLATTSQQILAHSYDTILFLNIENSLLNNRIRPEIIKLLDKNGHYIVLSSVNVAPYNSESRTLRYWDSKNKSRLNKLLDTRLDFDKTIYMCLSRTPGEKNIVIDTPFPIMHFFIMDMASLQQNCMFMIGIARKKEPSQ